MRTHVDENTGRQVRQLTEVPAGATVLYFRAPRYLPDGRVIAYSQHEKGHLLAVDAESGDVQPIRSDFGNLLRLRETDGLAWFWHAESRELRSALLPDGEPQVVGRVPEDVPGTVADVTCDGQTVITQDYRVAPGDHGDITSGKVGDFWRTMYRPRSADVWAYNLATGARTRILSFDGYSAQHIDTSPTDPGLLKLAQDGLAVFDQRIWAVRTDGTELRKIRPQEKGEWVHHEFWWPGGQLIGYKYMDRRGDWTIHELPWGEYAPRPLQLGIANLDGAEVYLSDPLEHYHSHLYVSRDARFVCGEGTHDFSFACAAPFSMADTRVRLAPMATVHTPYRPASAQGVETCFSAGNRWLIYNDTVDGVKQVCAVRMD